MISELRRPKPHGAVGAWLENVDGLKPGSLQLDRWGNAGRDEALIERPQSTHNILPMNSKTFRCWARLMPRQPDTLIEDTKIAETGKARQSKTGHRVLLMLS